MTTLALPETPFVSEARALLARTLPEPLAFHSIRAYLLARAYAEKRAIAFDDEALALAAVFHDFGLAAAHRDRSRPFVHASADVLRAFLDSRGLPRDRTEMIAIAILYHIQPWPRWTFGPVAGLLNVGAWMDIARFRRFSVRQSARAIDAAFPKRGLHKAFTRGLLGSFGSIYSCVGLLSPGTGNI